MEPYVLHVTSKGQLTLPLPIREEFEICKGSRLFVILDEDEDKIRLKKTEAGNVPLFTEKSSSLNLMGAFEGPHDLVRDHSK